MITTKITGLSAQGSNLWNGMAFSKNDVAITMYSDDVISYSNFKYIFKITDMITLEEYKFYVAPNAQNNGVFNAKTLFNELVPTGILYNNNVLLHINQETWTNDLNSKPIWISCYIGYDVGGVFTENTDNVDVYKLMVIYGEGKQNFIVMGTNDTLSLALSQAYDNTLGFNAETVATAINLPASLQNETINWQKISRSNVSGDEDSAYKILTWIADDGTYINQSYPIFSVEGFYVQFYDYSGNEIVDVISLTYNKVECSLLHIPIGLKNLVEAGKIDQETADNTAFWTIVGKNSGIDVTAKYGFYIESDCKYNPVHLYWLNQMGGIDSYSFIKKSERSIEVEKKRYKQYLGDYNNATTENPFSTQAYSRSLTEREPIVKTFLNLTSNWLTESEFKYMRDLFRSKSVWMVDDNVDGYSVIPVVVEDNNYLMRRERNSRKYNQNIRLQIANDNETLNIINTPYPIPEPVACAYYDVFNRFGGSSAMTLGANDGNACNIVVTNASRDRYIYVSLTDSVGNTPIAGQVYYVRIDYNFSCPVDIVRQGGISLGETGIGGGTYTSLQGLQNPGTPIIATGVWGTHSTTANNYFILTLPAWHGTPSTVSGNIYVTVGFGECP
jgi:hypothetical protein